MAYGAGAAGTDYGFFNLFGDYQDNASFGDLEDWALEQINRAEGGGTYTRYSEVKPAGWSGAPDSIQQSPGSTNAAKVIVAYWLAGAAQEGRYYGWSTEAVDALLTAAKGFFDAGVEGADKWWSSLSGKSRRTSTISEVFTSGGEELATIAASQPPLKSYDTYLLKFQQMGDVDSITFNKKMADASNLGMGEAIVGTVAGSAKDVAYFATGGQVGSGGALVAEMEREKDRAKKRREDLRPFLIAGGVALTIGTIWFLFKKD